MECCDACGNWFETVQGLMTHQSNSKKCAWYKKGKIKAIYDPIDYTSSEDEEAVERGSADGSPEERYETDEVPR